MNKDFYRAFEDKHRGPRELIKSRLRVYLPFVELLKNLDGRCFAVDLGCGRGEWLELMLELGFKPLGTDLDDGMLQACHELNLPAQKGDAIDYIHTLADDSQAIVSAFHVVEHISFEQLHTLVFEALRVLKPGGLLIMETPNPENIVVATRNFYLDPTHLHPIPSELLSFLPEFYGYARTKVLHLQESKELTQNMSPALNDVFAGVSPDYAVIAQKTAPEKTLSFFDEVFNQEYGLSFDTLAGRFDARLQHMEMKAGEAAAKASEAESKAQQAEMKAGEAAGRASEAESRAQQAEVTGQHAIQALNAIYASRSWRITAPYRLIGTFVCWFIRGSIAWLTFAPASRPRRIVRETLIKLKVHVSTRPRLKALVLRWLAYFPGLRTRFKVMGIQPKTEQVHKTPMVETAADISCLSPHARQIYNDLKTAIEQRQKENK